MAFICTHDTEVNWVLNDYGTSLQEVEEFNPDDGKPHEFFTLDKEFLASVPDVDRETPILDQIALIPRALTGPDGKRMLCFNTVYALPWLESSTSCTENVASEPGQRHNMAYCLRAGRSRGEYRLDSTGQYRLAKYATPVVLNKISINEDELGASTWELLSQYMRDRHDMKHSLAYTLANIPHNTFHRIRDPRSQPSKENLLKLGVIIQLSLEEMKKLLESAGLTFNPSNKRDCVIKQCFEKGALHPLDINKVLYREKQTLMDFGNFERLKL